MDGVPIIVSRITAEIEARGLGQEGLYRISAVKSQVEEMCALLEVNPQSANLDVDVRFSFEVAGRGWEVFLSGIILLLICVHNNFFP